VTNLPRFIPHMFTFLDFCMSDVLFLIFLYFVTLFYFFMFFLFYCKNFLLTYSYFVIPLQFFGTFVCLFSFVNHSLCL